MSCIVNLALLPGECNWHELRAITLHCDSFITIAVNVLRNVARLQTS